MISRNEVLALYRLILDREPESEEVVGEKRNASTAKDAAAEMLSSEEFLTNNNELLANCIAKAV